MVLTVTVAYSTVGTQTYVQVLKVVLRIHKILVRIRIRGSRTLTNGSKIRIRILLFSSVTSRRQQFFAYYLLFEGTFT